MSKKIIISGITILVLIVLIITAKFYLDSQHNVSYAKITVKVMDEQNNPIENARVSAVFELPKSSNPWDGVKTHRDKKHTNSDGICSLIGKGLNRIYIVVAKEGYYTSQTPDYKFKNSRTIMKKPWNPIIEIILRKKINPIPLYAKRFYYLKLPLQIQKIGFDIQKGDWVKPYGKGLISDIFIEYNRDHQDFSNFCWVLNVTMNSTNDGFYAITEKEMYTNSIFKLPYLAPKNKYTLTNILYVVDVKNGRRTTNTILPVDNYFFRFRTKLDDSNNVEECYYGKILEFDNQPALDSANLSFFMYYNPAPNDRNLEFDVKNSLFKDLRHKEQVKKP